MIKSFEENQMLRASRSATNNIAEGFGRFHYKENIQFCRQSRGSIFELLDHAIISFDHCYINENEFMNLRKLINSSLALLNGYINYLGKALKGAKENQITINS